MRALVGIKIFGLGCLGLLLMIPLSMIGSTVHERAEHRNQVLLDISRSDSGPQAIAGPVLVIPYQVASWRETDEKTHTRVLEWRSEVHYLLPRELKVNGRLDTEERRRGIYRATVYKGELELTGTLQAPAELPGQREAAGFRLGEPYVALGISDIRGIGQTSALQWDGQGLPFEPGTRVKALGDGMHADLPAAGLLGRTAAFSVRLRLRGTESFHVVPLGRDTEVKLTSPWPHPSFVGQFLPETRTVGESGFTATWRTSWFSTNAHDRFSQCTAGSCGDFAGLRLGVHLMDPVDVYLMSERAVKYGFLFVFMSIAGFFLFETLKRQPIHLIQYGLVGLSLALFFLLLLSLAEQIGFGIAYGLAATACVVPTAIYAGYILKQWRRGVAFGAAWAVLKGALFVLLQSEDYALLLGAFLLLIALAATMWLTRKVDWYRPGALAPTEL